MAWTRDIPSFPGLYWVASLEGKMAGTYVVRRSLGGELTAALGRPITWEGWWWDEAIPAPPVPPPKSADPLPEPSWRKIEDILNPEFPSSIDCGKVITYGKSDQ